MLLDCGVETTLESYLDSKEIKPANPKGNQSGIIIRKSLILKRKRVGFGMRHDCVLNNCVCVLFISRAG